MPSKRFGPKSSYEVEWRLGVREEDLAEDFRKEISERAVNVLEHIGDILVTHVRTLLNQKGTGKWWPSKKGKGLWHRASAPGKPPAVDRGEYRDSFYSQVERAKYEWRVVLRSTLWEAFGRRLELGGTHTDASGKSVYIAPRPHVRRTYDQTESVIAQALKDEGFLS